MQQLEEEVKQLTDENRDLKSQIHDAESNKLQVCALLNLYYINILHVCTCTLVGASVIEAESIRIRRSCGTALIGEVDSEFASQKA